MTDESNTAESKYTPGMCLQILQALLDYKAKSGVKGYAYHLEIKERLGIPESSKCLHENDPRHWYSNGHVPNKTKLDLYVRFLKEVDPGFKFTEDKYGEFIDAAIAISSFSLGKAAIADTKLCKASLDLDKKFFVSNICHGDLFSGRGYSCSMMSFKIIPGTPFLIAYKFRLGEPDESAPYRHLNLANSLVNKSMIVVADTLRDEDERRKANKKFAKSNARKYDSYFDELIDSGIIPILDFQKGILCPLKNGKGYHGILQAANYIPNHVLIHTVESDKLVNTRFSYRSIIDPATVQGVEYVACSGLKSFAKMLSMMGEPLL